MGKKKSGLERRPKSKGYYSPDKPVRPRDEEIRRLAVAIDLIRERIEYHRERTRELQNDVIKEEKLALELKKRLDEITSAILASDKKRVKSSPSPTSRPSPP